MDKFKELELDALREIVNMGLGRAAVRASELLNTYVRLSASALDIMDASGLSGFVAAHGVADESEYSVARQFFMGRLKGVAMTALPLSHGKYFSDMFVGQVDIAGHPDEKLLRQEALLEMGNILCSACVGRMAELIDDMVRYAPPSYYQCGHESIIPEHLITGNDMVLSLEVAFEFEDSVITGFLFLMLDRGMSPLLKETANTFINSL